MITGVPGVILRTGSCSTPQTMARYQPRRQSRKAMTQPSSSSARKGIRTIWLTRLTRRGSEHSEAAAAAVKAPRQEQTAQLADEFRRNRPRMPGVEARQHVAAQSPQRVAPEGRAVVEREVVVADGVHRRRGGAVVAVRAEAAGRKLEVIDRGARLEEDLAARGGGAEGEVALESIRDADEVLVEAAELEEAAALHGEVAGHDVRDEARRVGVKAELEVVGGLLDVLRRLAGLEDLSDDSPHRGIAMRGGVRIDERRRGDDVVVEKEDEVGRRGVDGDVHRVRDRRLRQADEADRQRRQRLVRRRRLVDDDDRRTEGEKADDRLDGDLLAVEGGDGDGDHRRVTHRSISFTPATP